MTTGILALRVWRKQFPDGFKEVENPERFLPDGFLDEAGS